MDGFSNLNLTRLDSFEYEMNLLGGSSLEFIAIYAHNLWPVQLFDRIPMFLSRLFLQDESKMVL